ncbi:MAG: endolytic transglycosylase MltG, partial [Bdellovibrionales bacterium]|nr:endolytic transglycosylase MltG [Bdellovibrionales bacterium]
EIGTAEELTAIAHDREFITSLNLDADSLEGYIYPATYFFTTRPSGKEFFSRAVATFWERLPADYMARIEERGLTLHQAVTFASLIELETRYADEKPLIAEVIWRRLKIGMALGIDASIIYGIEDYEGDLKFSHLRDGNNPYNTRIHPGLPPGPIGSPDVDSLRAVVEPADVGSLYYVLDVDTDGRHHFSKSLSEHNRYVRKLRAAARQQAQNR